MSQLKHSAVLRGDVLQDMATGQEYMLHPTEADMERGIWEYNEEADGHKWHYLIIDEVTYALPWYLDWEEEIVEWCQVTMGQWPFGNRPSDEEVFNREVEHVLWDLDSHLEAELDWMDQMENEENEVDDIDDDSDYDDISEDEGYNTSPEVDFKQHDFWALGLNSHIWRIGLYKDDVDGYWTL